ncbi:NUDIX hydrolase [Nitrogeniibacter aestuarii]|uniref:NUDIX hydrolase n=1 Tax=Nitrogeniibacter aestuarii TaxID=2815343 RepID=UPI001E50A2E5|nr:NUDIX domain-containing protein [Nitrogeniibacter aestuarii]
MNHALPLVTVDAVLLTLRERVLQVALHRRDKAPDHGMLALPGGFVHVRDDASPDDAAEDEDTDATVRRVLRDKTGFTPRYIEQLKVFSGRQRDPRRWSLSVAYVALVPVEELDRVGDSVFHFYDVDHLPDMAFDHAQIVAAAVARVRNKSGYSTLPCTLLPELFTLSQLQATYEAVLQTRLDKSSFRRRIDAWDVVEATEAYQTGVQRPARLYRLKDFALFDKTL